MGGPPPIGAKRAKLDPFIRDIILQFGYQEVGHVRAIKNTVKGFPRPLLDLSSASFAKVMDKAFGHQLRPPFDPYANALNFLLASYLIPYVGLTGYVGANPRLESAVAKKVFLSIHFCNKTTHFKKMLSMITRVCREENLTLACCYTGMSAM